MGLTLRTSDLARGRNQKPSGTDEGCRRVSIADFFGASSVASALGIRSGATPRGQPRNEPLRGRAVVAIGLHDPALLAGLGNRQLRGAFGALGERHDLLAELVVARFTAQFRQSLGDIGLFDLAPRGSCCQRLAGGREPQRVRIEFEQARRLRSRIAELEAQFDGVELRRQVGSAAGSCRPRRAGRWSHGRRCRSRNGRWICARGAPRSTRLAKLRAGAAGSGTKRPWRGCRFHPDRGWSRAGPGR